MPAPDRAVAVADIQRQERRKGTPSAVAGFGPTFTQQVPAQVQLLLDMRHA